jgi:hypothetical protein
VGRLALMGLQVTLELMGQTGWQVLMGLMGVAPPIRMVKMVVKVLLEDVGEMVAKEEMGMQGATQER